jgi:hypothetical protein
MCEDSHISEGDQVEEDVFSRLREMAELVIRDLQGAGVTMRPALAFSGPDPSNMVDVILTDSSGMSCGFGVQVDGEDKDVLYAMADRIPDAYVDLYAVGLPVVPGTQRPAVPKVVGNLVLWVDPKNVGGWSCPVGEYRQGNAS